MALQGACRILPLVRADWRTARHGSNDGHIQFGIDDIGTGDYLEIRGQEFPAGSGEILATILERDDLDTEAIIQGFIETNGVNRPAITVLGVTIETNGATVLQDVDDSVFANPDDFWNAISDGSLIKAKGTETSSQTITADEVEIQE